VGFNNFIDKTQPGPVPGTPFFVWIVRFGRHPSDTLLSDKLYTDPKPHKAAAGLKYRINGILREAVVDGEMTEGYFLRVQTPTREQANRCKQRYCAVTMYPIAFSHIQCMYVLILPKAFFKCNFFHLSSLIFIGRNHLFPQLHVRASNNQTHTLYCNII
jgi:hypothetical protein